MLLKVEVKGEYGTQLIESSFVPEVGTKITIRDLHKKKKPGEAFDHDVKKYKIIDTETEYFIPMHDGLEKGVTLIVEEIKKEE